MSQGTGALSLERNQDVHVVVVAKFEKKIPQSSRKVERERERAGLLATLLEQGIGLLQCATLLLLQPLH
eukprot:scaffold162396_cov32-Tisochrysis_lutea.AAC.3